MYYDNSTFVSEEAALIFYLTKTEGRCRNDLLGIKRIHYYDKILARNLYYDLLAKLSDKTSEAACNLLKIYRMLVDH